YTKDLLVQLGLESFWTRQSTSNPAERGLQTKWKDLVRGKIHAREEALWRSGCIDRPKLRTYILLKERLSPEPWLVLPVREGGLSDLVRLRGGSSRLRIEKGRFAKESVAERVCVYCNNDLVEDEAHFMLVCPVYDDLRSALWASLSHLTGKSRGDYTDATALRA